MDSDSKKEYIYQTSQSLKSAAIAWAKRFALADISLIEDILMDTVVHLIEINIDLSRIQHFPGYFFTAYKHRFYDYFSKPDYRNSKSFSSDMDLENEKSIVYFNNIQNNLETSLLIEDFFKKMDDKSRFIVTKRMLGYSYKEIADLYNQQYFTNIKENALRSLLNKMYAKYRRDVDSIL